MIFKRYMDLSQLKLKNPIGIIGLPGIGLVGKLAVEAIIEHAKPKKIADVYSLDFPPRVIVDESGIAKFLKTEIYLWKRDKQDVIIVTSDAQPQSLEGQFSYAKEISDFFKTLGVKMIVACAANVVLSEPKKPKVHVTGTSENVLKKFINCDNVTIFKSGSINGENGLIPVLANELYGIDGACLLAETGQFTEQVLKADPKASKVIVEVLNTVFKLDVDLSPLEEKIAEMHKALERIQSRLMEERRTIREPSEDTRSYIS